MSPEPVLLGISASMEQGAVALVTPGRVLHAAAIGPRDTISSRMIPLVRSVLSEHGFSLDDLTALGADVGPGSFTGIRVALSAVRAFSWVLGVPAARVFSLDVLARSVSEPHERFAVCLDARRGMLYAALYARRSGRPVRLSGPALVPAARVHEFAPEAALVGELPGVPASLVPHDDPPRYEPSAFAELLREAFSAGGLVPWWDLVPLYLRKAEAEEKWEEKHRGEGK